LVENKKENIHYFSFNNCSFNNEIYFVGCHLQEIRFTDCSFSKSLNITGCNINEFRLDKIKLDRKDKTFIALNNSDINRYCSFTNIKHLYKFLLNRTNFQFVKSHDFVIDNLDITNCTFEKTFQFTENTIKDKGYFKYNTFEKTNFFNSDFGKYSEFRDNDFNGTALFNNVKDLQKTELKFRSCKFSKYAYFNNAELNHLNLDTSKFIEFSSFQDTIFETIFIDRTVFENLTFFDDIKIKKIIECNRRTIRNIKQQLLRSDNNIDYDVFKSYELQAHRLEIAKKSKFYRLNKDWIILKVGAHFSSNGLSWSRAVLWTFLWSMTLYSIFYWHYYSNFGIENLDLSKYDKFLVGYFRYLIPTDFYNPFESNRIFLNNPMDWLLLIIGKIVIAIGLFEIIKSFRKFKK